MYPDTYLDGDADEYLVISGQGALDTLEITDGEGRITFPAGSVSSDSITIARDAEAFHKVTGRYPSYELLDTSPGVPTPVIDGRFQLANKKDELTLIDHGLVIQNLTWPGTFKPRKGQVHILGSDGIWDSRVFISGASRFESATFTQVSGTAFVSPDCGRSVLEQAITAASREILVNVYEFTDPGLADLLCQATLRGVKVTVLLEGGPVGGISPEEQAVIAKLHNSGISVYAMTGAGEDHAPYRYDHAKYLVIDGEKLLLSTENFKPHSFPPTGLAGNRGLGILMSSPELSSYFSKIFYSDLTGPGVSGIIGCQSEIAPYSAESYSPVYAPIQFTASSVTPVISPDTSDLILSLINGTSNRLLIEEAYIKHWSHGKRNPYLDAAIAAARRGVHVRILLDSYYYNIEDEEDNDEITAEITALANKEDLPIEARLLDLSGSGLLKLHAKGVIADDSVFISSINWNENSPSFNREAGLIIQDKTVAGYFSSVFEQDWQGFRKSHPQSDTGPDVAKLGLVCMILIMLGTVYWWRHRR
ncbi:phospholipase D-like domain-containing protein [Methanospirillum sp.]|uniref:phospholipase D-like domain-containing protein n=1 Tax=Methanospirillum sp. TaxID=45200 RepID=UPI00261CBB99|nr:phospholipase D-like domain-containing protein [Methanospirillum sp.]